MKKLLILAACILSLTSAYAATDTIVQLGSGDHNISREQSISYFIPPDHVGFPITCTYQSNMENNLNLYFSMTTENLDPRFIKSGYRNAYDVKTREHVGNINYLDKSKPSYLHFNNGHVPHGFYITVNCIMFN